MPSNHGLGRWTFLALVAVVAATFETNTSYDYIVVGYGPDGAPVAAKLA